MPSPFHPGPMIPELYSEQFALGSALVMLMVLCSICCALYLLLWKCCCAREQELFDKKGFKPLNNSAEGDDIDDDLSSSDSDLDERVERQRSRNRESGF